MIKKKKKKLHLKIKTVLFSAKFLEPEAQEAASQVALRNCSKVVGNRSGYIEVGSKAGQAIGIKITVDRASTGAHG